VAVSTCASCCSLAAPACPARGETSQEGGALVEMAPLCVLDFYVHESCQRSGVGKELLEVRRRGRARESGLGRKPGAGKSEGLERRTSCLAVA
jgi:GNAT superfamily N-acetyltransferase